MKNSLLSFFLFFFILSFYSISAISPPKLGSNLIDCHLISGTSINICSFTPNITIINSSYALNQTLTDMWSPFLNTTNLSYLLIDKFNVTNTSYRTLDNFTFLGNVNISQFNLTVTQNVTASWFKGSVNASDILNAPWLSTFTELDPKAYNGTLALNQTLADMWSPFLNTTNLTYLMIDRFNTTNTSYRTLTNITFVGNVTTTATGDFCISGGVCLSTPSSGDNSSWNQSYANTLYFGIGNWNATNTTYRTNYNLTWVNNLNVTSFINVTDINSTGTIWSANVNNLTLGYLYATNKTYLEVANWNSTNTSYLLTANWNATNTSYLLVANWNATNITYRTNYNISWVGLLNVTSDINSSGTIFTSNSFNLTKAYFWVTNSTFAPIGEPLAFNGTLMRIDQWNATNTSYLLTANWNATNTSYLLTANWNATNTSYLLTSNWNATNTSYRTLINGTFIGDWNVTGNLNSSGLLNASAIINRILTEASCDVKSYTNGTMYCGTDATAGLTAGSVNATHIAYSAINMSHLSPALVNATHINTSSINATHIIAAAINSSHIGNVVINSSHLQASSINASAITAGIINSSHMALDFNVTYAPLKRGYTNWKNVSTNTTVESSYKSVTAIGGLLNISSLHTALAPNRNYTFDCQIIFMTNVTTTGIALGMNVTTAVTPISGTIIIPVAADGTGAFVSGTIETNTTGVPYVRGTGTEVINTNYTAKMQGQIHVGTSAVGATPVFMTEIINTGAFVWGKSRDGSSYCKWEDLDGIG